MNRINVAANMLVGIHCFMKGINHRSVTIKHCLAVVVVFLLSTMCNEAWAQTDYVITDGTYYLSYSGGTLSSTSTFNASTCVWTITGNSGHLKNEANYVSPKGASGMYLYFANDGNSLALTNNLSNAYQGWSCGWYFSDGGSIYWVTWGGGRKCYFSLGNGSVSASIDSQTNTLSRVYVAEIELTRLDDIPSAYTLDVGETYQIKPTIVPSDANKYTDLTYTSSKTSVANVSSTGLITANSTGTATITVSNGHGVNATISVTVVQKAKAPIIALNYSTGKLTMTTSSTGASIYYTTDGSTPTESSNLYDATDRPTIPDAYTTIKAYAIGNGFVASDVTIFQTVQVATPVIAFAPTNGGVTATATITCDTEGSTIYYTTDGTDPTVASTPYTGGFNVNSLQTVKAFATHTNVYYRDSKVAELMYSQQKVPTPVINVRGYEVTFSCDEPGVTYYYTIGTNPANPTTSLTPWNGNPITGASGDMVKVVAAKSGFAPSEVANTTLSTAHVVYLNLANGNDSNDGTTAAKAKRTWKGAFDLLGYGPNAKYLRAQWAAHGTDNNTRNLANNDVFKNATYTSTVDNNIIYLVGDVTEAQFVELMKKTTDHPESEYALMNPIVSSGYFKPVTISGKYANSNSNTEKYARININAGQKYCLNEDMRFEYVEFHGDKTSGSTDFMLCYYDLEMGEGIIMSNFYSTKSFNQYHHGYKQGETNTAHILFYGGHTNDARFGNTAANALEFYNYYLPHPSGYKITIRSGYFSTISPGGTQWNQFNNINGAMGSPQTPVKCSITVDIDHKWNDDHAKGVVPNEGNDGKPGCDVAVVIAGTHEGTIFGDVDIVVKSGRIDRVVNGTFGANYFVGNYPADSYFGRANILIDPREPSAAEKAAGYDNKNELVVIRELYGGGLGRFKSDSEKSNQSSTYFYGKSTVTINGGTFQSAVYASGAGGVNGVGDSNHHTPDTKIPYLNGTTLTYGTWANYNSNNKLGITCHIGRPDINKPDFHTNDTEIDETIYLSDTKADIKIHGGIFGTESSPAGIYGGGYGFVDTELINYTGNNGAKPNVRAGAIFAAAGQLASSVEIDGDTEIYGNVYGAGRGSDTYKNANINYNGDDYTQLGQVAGNVELTIGGDAKIHGSVYGAGLGISGLTDMARLYGNTALTVKENAIITGGVYGGGENGIVDRNGSGYGNTIVNILGGTIGSATTPSNIHGGGLGSQTRVMGSVNLTVGEDNATTGPTVYGDVYGGSAQGKTNGDTSLTSGTTTTVTFNAGIINGSLYGGGLGTASNPADVYGPVQVEVYGGTINATSAAGSGAVYGCNNVNGAPKSTVKVDIYQTDPHGLGSNNDDPLDDVYAIDAVYGGGNHANYTYTANNDIYPKVTIHNCNNSIQYVYGGGNQATVPGTEVKILGGNVIGNVFGGGNNASVTTKGTNVTINGGRILNVYGGNNNGGTITGDIKVNVAESVEGCGVNINDLYGGGNLAASKAGLITIGKCTNITRIFGGANKANVNSDINLTITDGCIGTVFGGNNNSGDIDGTITVNVNWDSDALTTEPTASLGSVYGGGNLAPYTTPNGKTGPTVNILNAISTGNVFGGGLGATAIVTGNPVVVIGDANDPNEASHHVEIGKSVFGGGDAAAVKGEPKVTINVCGTVVNEDVYGGGNAAPVYSTEVNMKSGLVKGNIFGGGNGKGEGNPGANVGFEPDNTTKVTSKDSYGTTKVVVNGGTVGTWTNSTTCKNGTGGIFGGSNTKGDVWKSSTVQVEGDNKSCSLNVMDIYGAGNEAYMNGTSNIVIGCHAPKLNYLFGGAKNADVMNDINMAITNGSFGKIFGGNNMGGKIYGSIKVTIDETGCSPILIDELYGGGYNAPYDVNWGKYNASTGKGDGIRNPDPTVNVVSCSYIGQVFGGGYGATAVVTGNPAVNIQQITGKYDPDNSEADSEGTYALNTGNKLGKIGEVFGGGNAADIVGDTYVNIGNEDEVTRADGTTKISAKGANITGNVYGGGSAADVTGKTYVTVGRKKE